MQVTENEQRAIDFVGANPGCVVADLAGHMKITKHDAYDYLGRLRRKGLLQRAKELIYPRPEGFNGKITTWYTMDHELPENTVKPAKPRAQVREIHSPLAQAWRDNWCAYHVTPGWSPACNRCPDSGDCAIIMRLYFANLERES